MRNLLSPFFSSFQRNALYYVYIYTNLSIKSFVVFSTLSSKQKKTNPYLLYVLQRIRKITFKKKKTYEI